MKNEKELCTLEESEKMVNEITRLVEQRVKEETKKKLTKFMIVTGFTNLIGVMAAAYFIFFQVPDTAIKIAMSKMGDDIKGRVVNLQRDVDNSLKRVGKFEDVLPQLEIKANKIEQSFAVLNSVTPKDLNNTKVMLEFVRSQEGNEIIDYQEKINSLSKALNILDIKVKNIESGEYVFDNLKSQQVEIVDQKNNVRLILSSDKKHGRPSFQLFDTENKKRFSIYENASGYVGTGYLDKDNNWRMVMSTSPKTGAATIFVRNSGNVNRVSLGEFDSAQFGVLLDDNDGVERLKMLTSQSDGLPTVELFNKDKKKRLALFENTDGYVGLGLIDSNGNSRINMVTEPKNGYPEIALRDIQNRKRLALYENQLGYSGAELLDKDGNRRTILATDPINGISNLSFYNQKGVLTNLVTSNPN